MSGYSIMILFEHFAEFDYFGVGLWFDNVGIR